MESGLIEGVDLHYRLKEEKMSDGGRVKSPQSPGGWWIGGGKLTIKVIDYS
jgi:hypothetical protein